MKKTDITLELSSRIYELERLDQRLEQFCHDRSIPDRIIYQIEMAIEEILTNTISYGYFDDSEHRIKITVSSDNELLIFDIEDDGIPFNPLHAKPPDLNCPIEDRAIGGLGIHLAKCYMDDIVYERVANKNHLTMKKNIANV
jgi:serine/threonine-protein kinase RsbW